MSYRLFEIFRQKYKIIFQNRKTMNHLNWDDVRVFLALARTGTLTRAAQDLEIGIATLSRRIERLENALGSKLFMRSQTGYRLTEEASVLLASVEQMESMMLAFSAQAHSMDIEGSVKLATAENLASHLILPNLAQLTERYPKLSLELVTDVRTANLHRQDADLALRMIKPTRGNLTSQRLGTLGYGLYGKSSLERGDKVVLHSNNSIGWGSDYQDLPAAKWLAQQLNGGIPTITTTSLATQVAACREGLGFAVLPHLIAAQAGLTCVQTIPDIAQNIYLVLHADLRQTLRVRAVADFVMDLVQHHELQLTGVAHLA